MKVFIVSVERFNCEIEIVNVCDSLKKAKTEICKYLYRLHFDNELTDDSEEEFEII